MLDHDDEQRLAEIEEHLRLDAPDLHRLLQSTPLDADHGPLGPGRAVLRSIAALVAAVALTAVVTLVAGPNLGGLVAVIALSAAGMYAYQILRGCPGVRRARDDDR
jgi:hypothetical protein